MKMNRYAADQNESTYFDSIYDEKRPDSIRYVGVMFRTSCYLDFSQTYQVNYSLSASLFDSFDFAKRLPHF